MCIRDRDLWARFELHALTGAGLDEIRGIFGAKPENFLDVACDYLEAGFAGDALRVLDAADSGYPLVRYYRAWCLQLLGRESGAELAAAASMDTGTCFPSRLEDIAVLEYAASTGPADANACYYLGCLFYDRFRYEDAIGRWEEAVRRDPRHAKALRCLSLAYFDKRGDAASARACMELALDGLADPRLLFEYQQLLKNSGAAPDERLAVYDRCPQLLQQRDDCYLDRIVLLCMKGRYEEAIRLAGERHFHIYEGGEGNLTKQHAWMHVLYGNELAAAGRDAEAERAYRNGAEMPRSYGEAKTFFNQEAHLYFYLGLLLEKRGDGAGAKAAFEEASVYKLSLIHILISWIGASPTKQPSLKMATRSAISRISAMR